MQLLKGELKMAMRLMGTPRLSDITPAMADIRNLPLLWPYPSKL